MGTDGRVHTRFTHNPSSLRLSSVNPNLQNIPRGSKEAPMAKWVKECFVAPEGYIFWERDFSAIEAVLVGYFAGSPKYIRFAKMGVHAYLASHLAKKPVELSWSDAQIKGAFKELKASSPTIYDVAKRCVHGSNYLMTAAKMAMEYPEFFPKTKDAEATQDVYFGLFPEIREWQRGLCHRVDATRSRKGTPGESPDPWTLGVASVSNPFGYTHRFYHVLDWEKVDGEWISSFGEDAKRLVSFLPQSTAAAILKRKGKEIYHSGWVGRTMRLWVHDSIIGECPEAEVGECLEVSGRIMESPIPELPLDPSWGLGDYLTIGTEAKTGKSWATLA